jgi:predicted transport protein
MELIASEIKVYTEEEWMKYVGEEMADLYQKFRTAILNLDSSIEVKPTAVYIAFKKGNKNIVDIQPQQKALRLFINAKWGSLEDNNHIADNASNLGHSGNGDYQIRLKNDKDLEYIMSLVKQAL